MFVLALALASAVTVELHSAKGLDASDQALLSREVARAVERVTGAPPGQGADVSVAIDAHRVGGRIRIEAERRDKQRLVRRAEADLTRDSASWGSPLSELVAGLLPEGAVLARATSAAAPRAEARPALAVEPAPIALEAPAPAPAPVEPLANPAIVAAAPGRSRTVPWIVIGASTIVGGLGAMFAIRASNELDQAMPTGKIPDPAVLEAQQRSVFQGALIGSVLLSAAASGLVTGVVLLVSD